MDGFQLAEPMRRRAGKIKACLSQIGDYAAIASRTSAASEYDFSRAL